jgi:two-component system sensor histidine kinase AtoS
VAAESGPETVVADGFQLKHALLNLVLNALQATPGGGSIAIESAGDERGLEIAVRDTGEGMAEDVLPRVFDAFFTTREGGTGLGLPIARRIVEAHAGTLDIRSRPGRGTVARITLPVRPPGER